MMFPLIILYTIRDFLMDQKRRLERLDRQYKGEMSEMKKAEIREQQDRIFWQAMAIAKDHKRKVPRSVMDYFLGYKPKPSSEQITEEMQKIEGLTPKEWRVVKVLFVAFVSAWIVLKFLGLV